jgi:hypothetical protein
MSVNIGNGNAQCRPIAIAFTRFWPVRAAP